MDLTECMKNKCVLLNTGRLCRLITRGQDSVVSTLRNRSIGVSTPGTGKGLLQI
jgi:hypothetical protein